MEDRALKFPQWQGPVQELVLEFDPIKLEERIRAVEVLLFDRLQQLEQENGGHDEKIALQDALSIIRIMKRDRLDDLQSE